MSESHRDHDKSSSNTSSSHTHRNDTDDMKQSSRKRSHLDIDDVDAKVYVGNLPTEALTDDELLNFFKPYGKVSDIRVYKNHVFVQYMRTDDAKRLIKEGQVSLTFKGNKLEILPARDVRSTSTKSSSTDRSSQRESRERSTHRPSSSSTYEPTRKRFPTRDCPSYSSSLENNGRTYRTLSRSDSRRSSHDRQLPYTILTGPKNQSGCVDCQVIIVNMRQREYAEKIESRLSSHGLVTSIIFLREDYSLTQAIDNATQLQCLYGIIAMPMHEERRTASFHILYGQTEEHRNLSLEDGIHIIVTNYLSYKESLHSNETTNTVMYTAESLPSYEYQRETNNHVREEISPPVLTLNDKLPLSMLLCLLADGRQLTLEEIDRVLVYLLEKKAKMLTLPTGTLPPLPAQYANVSAFNHSTNSISSDTRPFVTSDSSVGKTSVSATEVSSTIAEQIRQFLTTNIVKSNGSIVDSSTQPFLTKAALEKMPDIVKIENPTITQSKNNVQDQSTTQTNFGFQKNETLPVVMPPFNYTAPAVSSTSSTTPFTAPNFPSFNSALKPTTTVNVPNFVSQPSQFFYPIPAPPNVFPSTLNTAAVETTAAILQAYSQFSVQPPSTTSIVGQQLNTQQKQQQQQIRK